MPTLRCQRLSKVHRLRMEATMTKLAVFLLCELAAVVGFALLFWWTL